MDLSDKQLLKELVDSSLSAKNLQRRALAKLITLLESTLSAHQIRADAILNQIIPLTGKSFRLGISGVPGVGKSTLIEALGLYLIAQGHRVAVLAIDPSSTVSGGSILGDQTRMEQLSTNSFHHLCAREKRSVPEKFSLVFIPHATIPWLFLTQEKTWSDGRSGIRLIKSTFLDSSIVRIETVE